MTTIHWVHAGADALFGLAHLQNIDVAAQVWTREGRLPGIPAEMQHPMDMEQLWEAVQPGDIVVAPRPTEFAVARLAMERGAHLAVGWHASAGLRDTVADAADRGLCVLAEAGMVPGIEHLMARDLVNDYSYDAQPGDVLHFTAYGGGVPKYPDNFRHKFNTSPLSLLNALATPTSWIGDGRVKRADFPFDVIRDYDLHLPTPERHQVYPHYDVAPYLAAYGFDPAWQVQTAERGAIRLKGWRDGWAEVFDTIRQTGKDAEALQAMAETLWAEHPFAPTEADRVVLSVMLRAENDGRTRWHKEWVLDAVGDRQGWARYRLNSLMLALAARAIADGQITPGLHIGPTDPDLIAAWLVEITHEAGYSRRINQLREKRARSG
ncbi:saccharopine dehydrogenase C-terminal domain-containing protein [Paracoccus sp. S1E-3]|uniref:saccharopine dehydrogenase C-terminal domain-containing protein n=1 Tax=Paracoccus sp. S1E-3 TaxID=2756130 RepID=UPI0015EFD2BE|nr:saccharopine dehydrogenase C-terminal domain-containing protein [Paracoccus sp. S1E-3]MBA4490974.1 hypothetical protein [Paracoccus sp. S1E-3]